MRKYFGTLVCCGDAQYKMKVPQPEKYNIVECALNKVDLTPLRPFIFLFFTDCEV